MASYGRAVTGTAVMARSANEEKKKNVTPSKVSLFHSSLTEANTTEDQFQQLVQPFQHVELPQETYRHLFVRAGGPASSLDVWLRERSRE